MRGPVRVNLPAVVVMETNMDEEIAQWISAAVSLGAAHGVAG